MKSDTIVEVRALGRMTVGELRERYREVFSEETRSHNKQYLVRRIAWQLQARVEGGLSERARRRAEELADETYLRTRAPKGISIENSAGSINRTAICSFSPSHDNRLPMPGTVLTRKYKGETIAVTVLDSGFGFDGDIYRSLTAVAKTVTGSHWNGYHFFGLGERR